MQSPLRKHSQLCQGKVANNPPKRLWLCYTVRKKSTSWPLNCSHGLNSGPIFNPKPPFESWGPLLFEISCTRIAYALNSRKFHVAEFSCSTVMRARWKGNKEGTFFRSIFEVATGQGRSGRASIRTGMILELLGGLGIARTGSDIGEIAYTSVVEVVSGPGTVG